MRSRKQNDLDYKFIKYCLILLGLLILAMLVLALVTHFHKSNSSFETNGAAPVSSSVENKKNLPLFENEKEKQHIKDGLQVGMQAISEAKSLPMVKINFFEISTATSGEIDQYFDGDVPVQALNDLTNLATRDGYWYQGDSGANSSGTVKSPKRGTLNKVDYIEFKTYTKNKNIESIKIKLFYTPEGFKGTTKKLIVDYDSKKDLITDVKQDGDQAYED